jgi:hypothetical protein
MVRAGVAMMAYIWFVRMEFLWRRRRSVGLRSARWEVYAMTMVSSMRMDGMISGYMANELCVGATWCQDYKILTCANHRVERTGAGCDSTQSHRPDEHQRPEGRPEYDPHHKGPENNATEKRGEGGGIPEWHRPVDDDGQHASNETEHDGPPGPPGQRPGDGEGYGNGPGKGEGHGPDGHGPGGHGPQTNGTRPHGPPDTPGYEHTPDKAHGHHPPYGFPNGTEPHPPSPTGTPGGSPTGTPGGPGEHGPEGHGPGGHGPNGAEPLPTPIDNYKPDAYANKDRKRRIGDERYELLDREHGPLGIPIEDGDGGE